MAKKPLTPEQRQRKRERDREYYARKRQQAGQPYTPKGQPFQAVQQATDKFVDLMKTVVTGKPKKKKSKAPAKGVKALPKRRTDNSGFVRFVQDNPDIKSARTAISRYRTEVGLSISNEQGYRLFREAREAGKHYSQVRFRMYGPTDHPASNKHFLFPRRFMYNVSYEVEAEDLADTVEQFQFISSSIELTIEQIVSQTIQQFQIGQETGIERYKAKRILIDTIRILYGVDRLQTTPPHWVPPYLSLPKQKKRGSAK